MGQGGSIRLVTLLDDLCSGLTILGLKGGVSKDHLFNIDFRISPETTNLKHVQFNNFYVQREAGNGPCMWHMEKKRKIEKESIDRK